MTKHARLAPSSAAIWLTCESAPSLWPSSPPKTVGFAANEGTLAHTLCEGALTINAVPWKEGMQFVVEGKPVEITGDMLNAVQLYIAQIAALRDQCEWSHIETQVDIGELWEGEPPERVFGTSDFFGCDAYTLFVVDFKYGRGKAVQPEFNPQLLIYAIAAWLKLERERPDLAKTVQFVSMAIIQPRAGGNPIRVWTIPIGELVTWAYMTLKPAVDRIVYGEPEPFTAGNHCYFCPSGQICPTLRAYRLAKSIERFPDFEDEEGEKV